MSRALGLSIPMWFAESKIETIIAAWATEHGSWSDAQQKVYLRYGNGSKQQRYTHR